MARMNALEALSVALLVLMWAGEEVVRADKLPHLPGQYIAPDHKISDVDIRSVGTDVALSPPSKLPTPPAPRQVLDAPPAPVPTFPPAFQNGESASASIRPASGPPGPAAGPPGPAAGPPGPAAGPPGPAAGPLGPVPAVNGLYDVPKAETIPQTTQGSCQAQTVVVTSREVVVSTRVSFSQVYVPTTVVQRVTSTRVQLQTAYVTVQGPVQVVTSRVVEAQYFTVTRTNPVLQTVISVTTQYQPQYLTTTQIQYVPNTVCASVAPSTGYSYPAPAGSGADTSSVIPTGSYDSGVVRPAPGGYIGSSFSSNGYNGPFYGPFYARPVPHPQQSRKKGFFAKWGF